MMNKFDEKVEAIRAELSDIPYGERGHIRFGSVRNLAYISQWDYLPKTIDEDKPIVLYGAGQFGKAAASLLLAAGVNVSALVDSKKAGGVYDNKGASIPIISLEECMKRYPDAYIQISVADTDFYCEIKKTLDERNIRHYDVVGYYFLAGLKQAYVLLDDDLSRVVLLDYIKYLTGYSRYGFNYFDKRLVSSLTDNEIFVDAGVFNGDTVFDFIKHVNGKYRHIYGFEANSKVFKKYKETLCILQNITLENIGLWSCDANLAFAEGVEGGSSFVNEFYEKNVTMPATTLDKYFEDIPMAEWPTFIKMDIEGAEYEALLGSKTIIQKAKPKMAISVYHKMEHFWQVPELLRELNPGYTFFLRHYAPYHESEYVLYAI